MFGPKRFGVFLFRLGVLEIGRGLSRKSGNWTWTYQIINFVSVAGEKGGGRSAATRFVLTLRELTTGGRSVSTLPKIGGNFTQKLDEMGDFCKLRKK